MKILTTGALALGVLFVPMVIASPAIAASPSSSVSGHVVTGHGDDREPVATVKVKLVDKSGAQRSVRTDAAGRFTITNVASGDYKLKVVDDIGHVTCDGGCSGTQHYLSEWLGNVRHSRNSRAIHVDPNSNYTGVNFVVGMGSDIGGSVQIDGRNAKKSDRVVVELIRASGKVAFASVARPDFAGTALPAGSYKLRVSSRAGEFETFFVKNSNGEDKVYTLNGVDARLHINIDVTGA